MHGYENTYQLSPSRYTQIETAHPSGSAAFYLNGNDIRADCNKIIDFSDAAPRFATPVMKINSLLSPYG